MKRDPRELLLLDIAAWYFTFRHDSGERGEQAALKVVELWQQYDDTYGEAKTEKEIEFRRLYGHP